MDCCYLKQANTYSKWNLFLFLYFHYKKGLKKLWVNEDKIKIFYMPVLKKKKHYKKIIEYLKEQGIKKVCMEQITEEFLLYQIKTNFEMIKGEAYFYTFFEKIIDKFMKMHFFVYEECELIFICDHPQKLEEPLEKSIKKFKKISIYTTQSERFLLLKESLEKNYGVTLFLKDKKDKPKKYKKIYVNLENENVFCSQFFKNVYLIDIFKVYIGGFNEILFQFPFKQDALLKEHNIKKNICFLEYLSEKSKISIQKNYKIVNIKKI